MSTAEQQAFQDRLDALARTVYDEAQEFARIDQIAVDRALYEESLYEFVKGAWPSIDPAPWQDNWAIEAFCEHLEAVTLGQITRLIANLPPRCCKTTVASICWPAWIWARRERLYLSGPQVRLLCGSYNDTLSLSNSNSCRSLIYSPWYQRHWGHRYQIKGDQNTKSNFENTERGARIAVSVNGSLLGLGGDLIVVDDPHNTESAESDAERARAIRWWREIHSTRLNQPKQSAVVLLMQRLHANDLTGYTLDSDEDWTHLCIPMTYDETQHRRCVTVVLPKSDDGEVFMDPRGQGELMWEERFGPNEIEAEKKALGPYMYSGRYQQSPHPAGGGIIRREWWMPWDAQEAARYDLEWTAHRKEFPACELVVASLDTAQGEKEENDFNALTVWGVWEDLNKNKRAMLMYSWAVRKPLHGKEVTAKQGESEDEFKARRKEAWGLVDLVADTCRRYKVRVLLIEAKSRGQDVANEIIRLYAREKWRVVLVNPTKDKVSRAHSEVPLFVDEAVFAPDTTWAEATISQCEGFPKVEHDDLVDTVTQFLKWARENHLLLRGDEMSAAITEDTTYQPHQDSVAQQYGVSG